MRPRYSRCQVFGSCLLGAILLLPAHSVIVRTMSVLGSDVVIRTAEGKKQREDEDVKREI